MTDLSTDRLKPDAVAIEAGAEALNRIGPLEELREEARRVGIVMYAADAGLAALVAGNERLRENALMAKGLIQGLHGDRATLEAQVATLREAKAYRPPKGWNMSECTAPPKKETR